jgi:hypothetical protein
VRSSACGLRRALFFERGPAFLPPRLDRLFVALRRPRAGLLDAVAHGLQEAADVRGVIELTPQVRRMTSATRWHVPICPRKPYASAPASKSAGSWARCSALSRDCRPGAGAGCRRSPSTPCSRARLRHWLTAPALRSPPAQRQCPALFLQLPGASPPSLAPVQLRHVIFVLMPPAYHLFSPLRNPQ